VCSDADANSASNSRSTFRASTECSMRESYGHGAEGVEVTRSEPLIDLKQQLAALAKSPTPEE
jgi:hypothetical protein